MINEEERENKKCNVELLLNVIPQVTPLHPDHWQSQQMCSANASVYTSADFASGPGGEGLPVELHSIITQHYTFYFLSLLHLSF